MQKLIKFIHKKKENEDLIVHKKKKNHLERTESSGDEALVPWVYDNIPYSYKQWLRINISKRADKLWNLGDEITTDAAIENIEYYFRLPKMTKAEKKLRVASVLRANGIKGATAFTEDIFQQLEVFIIEHDTEASTSKRQSKLLQVENSPRMSRQRSQSII